MSSKYWVDENACGVPGRHVHYGQNVVLPIPEQLGPFVNELRAEVERLQKLGGGLVRDNSELTRMLNEVRVENERLRAELARWKPSQCGKIFPVPVPCEAIKYCTREYDHGGAHLAETGEAWVFSNDGAWPATVDGPKDG